MRNRLYGGVRGRKMKVGRKLLHFPPTRLFKIVLLCCNTHSLYFADNSVVGIIYLVGIN